MKAPTAAVKRKVLRYLLAESHIHFSRYFFKHRDGINFIENLHHVLVSQILDQVIDGDINRLIINVPPGYTKTELAVIFFMARGLAVNAQAKFIHTSYSDDLALLNSSIVRDVVESEAYQELWPRKIRVDTAAKKRWFTEDQGGVYAVSSGGAITGFRAGRMELDKFTGAFIIDDPLKPDDAYSDATRTRINNRFMNTIKSRLAVESVPIIVIMQRLHEDDLSAFLLKGGSGEIWDHLLLPSPIPKGPVKEWYPAEFTHGRPIEYTLPEGPLWEFKHDKEALEVMYKVDPYTASSQYGQRPSPLGGGLFKSKWWKRWIVEPQGIKVKRIYGDTAQKTAERNDYSVFQCWGWVPGVGIFLLDQIRGKWEAPELKSQLVDFWNKHNVSPHPNIIPVSLVKVEDKSSGIGLIQDVKSDDKLMIPIEGIPRNKDKVERAFGTIPHIAAGHVHIPAEAEWISEYTAEFTKFTPMMTHKNDDQIDPTMDAIEDLLVDTAMLYTGDSLN